MVATSLPVELLAKEQQEIQKTQETQYTIVSFEGLPDEVKEQNAGLGTPMEELELPGALTASYRSSKNKTEDEEKPEEEKPGDEDGEKTPDKNAGEEGGEKTPDENAGDENEEKTPGENAEDENGEKAPSGSAGDESGEKALDGNVKDGGEKAPENNAGTEVQENTSSETDKGNKTRNNQEVGDGNQTPELAQETVEVHMKEYRSQPENTEEPKMLISDDSEPKVSANVGTGSDASLSGESEPKAGSDKGISEDTASEASSDISLSEEAEYKTGSDTGIRGESEPEADSDTSTNEESETKPDSDAGVSEDTEPKADTKAETDNNEEDSADDSIETIIIEGITWVSTPEYDSDTEGRYIFTPILPGNYILEESAILPEITVTVAEAADLLEEAEEPLNDEAVAPALGTIDTDTTWEAGTLTEGTLTIKPGVTLTITDAIEISGNVTIEGGGNIERGDASAYFGVGEGSKLTIGNITVDGKELRSSFSMISVASNGELILDEGCAIRNCVSSGYGGAITSNGSATLNGATIEKCSASNGGAICSNRGTLIINSAMIENCSATQGGAIHASGGSIACVTLNNSTIKDCVASASAYAGGAIYSVTNVTLNGTTIKNCSASSMTGNAGAIYIRDSGSSLTLTLNDATIEGCSSYIRGGAIAAFANTVINGGTYRNNITRSASASGYCGGGFIYICSHTLKIYSGDFINNSAANKGGCIYNCGDEGTTTYLYGGRFEGNTCSNPAYSGGGAVCNSAYSSSGGGVTSFILSGDIEFVGDGNSSKTDGIFLDSGSNMPRMLWLRDALSYPIAIHLNASDGYLIAEGMKMDDGNIFTILKNRDMKKMSFYDTNGKDWYGRLDKEYNRVYLSPVPPYEDAFFVYYINNGAKGPVIEDDNNDDNGYESGATTIVQEPDGLYWENHKFIEWNTKADDTGDSYAPGDELTVMEDTNLYAIFKEIKGVTATFYSGEADHKEVISEEFMEGDDGAEIKAPDLVSMPGWDEVGWDLDKEGYTGDIAARTQLTLSENTQYYGVYKKDVTLSYKVRSGNSTPGSETKECRANVHESITYDEAGFRVADDIAADDPDWKFGGWNTEPDGTGITYKAGDTLNLTEDTVLYDIFEIPPYAYFYSGSKDDEPEVRKTNVVTHQIIAPHLKEKSGWTELGWDGNRTGFDVSMDVGETRELAEDTPFYGVYEKKVTLSYYADEGATVPASSTQTRLCKVNDTEILYKSAAADPESFEFDIATDISKEGYEFFGWNTSLDGRGDFYRAQDTDRNKISISEDTVLYAIFRRIPVATFYSGTAGQYVEIESDYDIATDSGTVKAPDLKPMAGEGWAAVGWDMDEAGYSGDIKEGSEITLYEDTSYYAVYEKEVGLLYDASDWVSANPDRQSDLRYANVHDGITYTDIQFNIAPAVSRPGYSFVGWSPIRNAIESPDTDYYSPDDTIAIEDDVNGVILYAQMKDDIAPRFGQTSYNSGYKDVKDWIVRKKDMVITVPITEEGSGVNKIAYALTPENGEAITGEATMGEAHVPRQLRQEAAVQLNVAGSRLNEEGSPAQQTGGKVGITDGQIMATITVAEDYKGTVFLRCIDIAGNEASETLTALGGGIIVEDNAPQITCLNQNIKNGNAVVTVSVSDDVDIENNSRITGGIADITYQVDDMQEQKVTAKDFSAEIVPSCEFNVDISGVGEHTLKVTALDNAGNESKEPIKVEIKADIKAKKKKSVVTVKSNYTPPAEEESVFIPFVKVDKPEPPKDSEPHTGDDSVRVEVYATIAMISGLLYILMYFSTGNNGMTEEEKNEFVSRMLNWAKHGGRCRRMIAIATIFCVLCYYHSIGKRINLELEEI